MTKQIFFIPTFLKQSLTANGITLFDLMEAVNGRNNKEWINIFDKVSKRDIDILECIYRFLDKEMGTHMLNVLYPQLPAGSFGENLAPICKERLEPFITLNKNVQSTSREDVIFHMTDTVLFVELTDEDITKLVTQTSTYLDGVYDSIIDKSLKFIGKSLRTTKFYKQYIKYKLKRKDI